jgi:FkbM family methyltransferase
VTSLLSIAKQALPDRWKRRVKHAMGFQDMQTRLANLARAGFHCTGAVDVGAYAGDWARLAHATWACPVLAFEPLPQQDPVLRALAQRMPLTLEPLALSDQPGRLAFSVDETNSRLADPDDAAAGPRIEVAVERLDHVLQRHPALRPNLLKADVQGAELKVLAGAGSELARFEVVILEVSLIRIGPVPVFAEVIEFMAARGLRLYDFLPMYYRPRDGALWQGDAFFVRDDSPLVASRSWA